ncbi:hypothetical protein [Helicobacter suis]|uniref:hypothetical protein n=1 Tax=Helicobacter suis TaxID=104628 RepID=UPI0013D25D19|nr:hypothetical protein [Helicobacter suis]
MPKEHSGSFLLEQGLLELLDFIAEIECQSRAVIIERILKFYLTQQRKLHAKGSDSNKKKCNWKKSKTGVYKTSQKVFSQYRHSSAFKPLRTQTTHKPECFTQKGYSRCPRAIQREQFVYPRAHSARSRVFKSAKQHFRG